MAALRRRMPWVAGVMAVLLVAALAVGVTLWVKGAASAEAEIDLNLPTLNEPDQSRKWDPKVRNDSAETLTDVEFAATIVASGGDAPPIELADPLAGDEDLCTDDPDSEPSDDCLKSAKKLKREACKVPHSSQDTETGVSMSCGTDLKPGVNAYKATFTSYDAMLPMEHEKLRDHPDVTVRAKLSVAGKVVDTAEAELKIVVPRTYDRVEIDGLPQDMSIDDPASKTHEWSMTVTNDTDDDVSKGWITIELIGNPNLLEIGAVDDACETESPVGSLKERVNCADANIPAGDSVTVKMRMNVADGAAKLFKETCYSGHPTEDKCRDERSGANLKITVSTKSETFAESGAVCRVKVDD